MLESVAGHFEYSVKELILGREDLGFKRKSSENMILSLPFVEKAQRNTVMQPTVLALLRNVPRYNSHIAKGLVMSRCGIYKCDRRLEWASARLSRRHLNLSPGRYSQTYRRHGLWMLDVKYARIDAFNQDFC